MTDTPADDQAAAAELPPLAFIGQFTKDLSFEAPHVPEILEDMAGRQPQISLEADVRHSRVNDRTYCVDLSLSVKTAVGDKVAFLIELVYRGVVTVNVPEEHLLPVLLVQVPTLLFPFAREIVCSVVMNSGFPPVMLAPIDFVSLYQHRLAAAMEEAKAAQAPKN